MGTKYFFSPQPSEKIVNKYVEDFYSELESRVSVARFDPHIPQAIQFIRTSVNSNVMILNWPEDIIHLRGGLFQALLSMLAVLILKLRSGTVIWVCHNKESHNKGYPIIQKMIRKYYERLADHIVVHSRDALQQFNRHNRKLKFEYHPVYKTSNQRIKIQEDLFDEVDVLIWGTISPYKGILELLQQYTARGSSFSITIAGKGDERYIQYLETIANNSRIKIYNRILNESELNEMFLRAKIILLPFLSSDTFSSGSLIHSLNSRKIVIGPSVGNFRDMEELGACYTYTNYDHLFSELNKMLCDDDYYNERLTNSRKAVQLYSDQYTWSRFVGNLLSICDSNVKTR